VNLAEGTTPYLRCVVKFFFYGKLYGSHLLVKSTEADNNNTGARF